MTSRAPAQPLDVLTFPFHGAQVIEASAGTGKTYTLAGLYVRLVLGDGPGGTPLQPPQILVMTFTEAATQELKDRIRRRLGEAAAWFRDAPGARQDELLRRLRARHPAADWPLLAQRLEQAGQWMDEAAIHTIHGWSSRVLRQHAFDSRSLFRQERVEDSEGLLKETVRDYWRHWIYPLDVTQLDALRKFPASPDALLVKLRPALARLNRAPLKDPQVPPDPARVFAAWARWHESFQLAERAARARWRACLGDIESQLQDAWSRGALSGAIYKADKRAAYLARMREWCAGESLAGNEIERFSLRKLHASKLKAANPLPDPHGAFALLDALHEAADGEPLLDGLFEHAAAEVLARCAARKRERAQFDFNDLLQRLYGALREDGGSFAAALRLQYPVALVDEFQDTDAWQYGALQSIYLNAPPGSTALVMIGDPKQAIYSFRGADLSTYLAARDAAQGQYSLVTNYRSTPALVNAVNQVFESATQPFGVIGYERVAARREDVQPLVAPDGQVLAGLTVWYEPSSTPLGAEELRERLAASFATQIVTVLSEQADVTPADVAVLVRDFKQAGHMRQALLARGVRSVYLSERDSVFDTPEALELWYILRAVAQPRSPAGVRAALATRCFGHSPHDLDRLLADEAAFDAQVERFVGWQERWQRQGFLAMLYALLHEEQIPARLMLADQGERSLTNLLHLGDLLQQASLSLQGEVALLRHLADQLDTGTRGQDATQLRLETDADLVKIVTLHKSKGLQYPVVFLPFAHEFMEDRQGEEGKADREAARHAEDIRLLYVAFTRAERALFVGAGTRHGDLSADPKKQRGGKGALSRLLGRADPTDLAACLARWTACKDIQAFVLPETTPRRFLPAAVQPAPRAAAVPLRRHESRWRSTSFSALTRGLGMAAPAERDERFRDAQTDSAGEASEPVLASPLPFNALPAGAQVGDLLHGLLEWQIEAGWPIARADEDASAWHALLARRGQVLGLDAGQQAQLGELIAAIARCPLGEAVRDICLAQLPAERTWAEMGFQFCTQGLDAAALDTCVQEQVLPDLAREPLAPQRLEGQLTGFLDLLFEHEGRYFVLDYKSNRLQGYEPARLREAIASHRYDLQYTLYVLALHRLLTSRLPDYDYDLHVGGALYCFVRGIGTPGNGVFHDRPPRALIEYLDAGFRGTAP